MKKIRKRLPAVLLILLAVLFVPGIANAKTKEYQGNLWNFKKTVQKTSGAFTYYAYPSKNQKEAWIYKIDLKSGKNCSKLSIPSKLDNKKVTRLGSRETREGGEDPFYDIFGFSARPWNVDDYVGGVKYKIDRIKKLEIPNTVKIIQPACFSNMHSIKAVKIPKSVKTLGKYTFFRCNNLKKVELSAGLNSLDEFAFYNCTKLTDIRVSSKNKTYQSKGKYLITKKKKELILAPASKKTLKIPDGIKSIKPFAFGNCTSATVHVPASVKKIEGDAFSTPYSSQSVCIKNVTLDDKNSVYAKDGQCIYNKTDKSLTVAIPDETGNLYISDQVEKLTSDRGIVGWNVRGEILLKVVYPKNLKTVADYGFIKAERIYFTGEKPPELVRIEAEKENVAPPAFTHVYVPEGSAEIYRQWYKDHGRYDDIYGFDTFKPEDKI